RRRGAARKTRQGAVQARHRPHALYSGRADDGLAFPRRRKTARSAARAGQGRQFGRGDRAQPRSHQDRRLDHRPWPRRRRRRRRDRRRRPARGDREGEAQLYRAVLEAGAGATGRGEAAEDGSGGVIDYCSPFEWSSLTALWFKTGNRLPKFFSSNLTTYVSDLKYDGCITSIIGLISSRFHRCALPLEYFRFPFSNRSRYRYGEIPIKR